MKEAVQIRIIILLGMICALLLGSCTDKEKEQQLSATQTELVQTQKTRDSMEANMIATLDEIDKRIGIIKSQKGYLMFDTGNHGDLMSNSSKKEQILNNIALMNELINDNEVRIDKLRAELKKMGSGNKELHHRIARYEKENKEISDQVADLKTQLDQEKLKTESLTAQNEKLNIEASNQVVMYDNLHTQYTKAEQDAYVAYIAKGKRKDLKKEHVIEKKNLLTLTAPDKLSVDAKNENFEKIDTRTTLQIPLDSKSAKLVTAHDENSYKWCDDPDGTKCLCIVDPHAFWEKSKYLVIETK
jgi:chromosome segregation ATPase